jgi:hypothetical protein
LADTDPLNARLDLATSEEERGDPYAAVFQKLGVTSRAALTPC